MPPDPAAREAEVAWVGGFFSGEGCISAGHNRDGRAYAQLSIGNTDLDALLRCQAVIGGQLNGPYAPRDALGKLPAWTLKAGNQAHIRQIVAMLLPWLSPSKAAQARSALDAAAGNPPLIPHTARRWDRSPKHSPVPVPCKKDHPLSDRYLYTNPGTGHTGWKCRGCQAERDAGRKR